MCVAEALICLVTRVFAKNVEGIIIIIADAQNRTFEANRTFLRIAPATTALR
jgi:hypothetical protein